MGLDQYAYSLKAEALNGQTIDIDLSSIQNDPNAQFNGRLAYWRKFNHLQGWVEQLYIDRGGCQDFNCIPIRLFPEDLDRLEADALANRLKHTAGFFFGGEELYPEDVAALHAFIREARSEIAKGRAVLYDSWW